RDNLYLGAVVGCSKCCQTLCVAAVPQISVVDDDESVRESLRGLLRSVGFAVRVFASGEEFMNSGQLRDTGCLILDVRMPGMSGPCLQGKLAALGSKMPVIFITAHEEDEQAREEAMRDGAVDYLINPLREEAILNAVQVALRPK